MNNIVPFINSKGSKKTTDGEIVDHGKINDLQYEIYKRGVIHIFKNKSAATCRFKKDIDSFDTAINKLDFEKLEDGKSLMIEGSGDNDNLIFTKKDDDINISLKAKGFKTIERLKEILNIKQKKAVNE
jgi:hypothetical protein